MYLATHNFHCNKATILKFSHYILLTYYYALVKIEDDMSNPSEVMINQTQEFGKAIRPLYADLVKNYLHYYLYLESFYHGKHNLFLIGLLKAIHKLNVSCNLYVALAITFRPD